MVKSNPNDTRVYGKKYQEMCRKSQAKYRQNSKAYIKQHEKRIIFLFTEKARKRQQLANWFRFIMRRPFHGAVFLHNFYHNFHIKIASS